MKKSIVFTIFLAILALFSFIALPGNVFPCTAEAASTSARAMAVVEANTGRVFMGKNKDSSIPMASTTKIMTALVALENCVDLDALVEINSRAVGIEGTSLYLRKGEKLSVRELLYGVMLSSGNDASVAVAYAVAGSEERFVEMMNEKVESLGLKNTRFANPHGLDADGHYTSAYDLAMITSAALKNEDFREISTTKNVTVSGNEEVAKRHLYTKNKLLKSGFEGCLGVKTGFTDKAGRCFVAAAEREGVVLVCVVLNCGPMFEESENLLEACFRRYKSVSILNSHETIGQIGVLNGAEKSVSISLLEGFSYVLSEDEFASLKVEYDFPDEISAPVEKEQVVGNVKVYLENDLLFETNIYTLETVDSILFRDKLAKVLEHWHP